MYQKSKSSAGKLLRSDLWAISQHLRNGRLLQAEALSEVFLQSHPDNAEAISFMAEAKSRLDRLQDAERLFARYLEISPDDSTSRLNYANVLVRLRKLDRALAELDTLLVGDPENQAIQGLQAHAQEQAGNYKAAVKIWRALSERNSGDPNVWMRYGHALNALGNMAEAVAAYRKALVIEPGCGKAWWALADLKTYRFTNQDISGLEQQVATQDIETEDRIRLHFALGKGFADLAQYEKSFAHYAKGNALQRVGLNHDPETFSAYVKSCQKFLTRDFYRSRAGYGCADAAPIFIVGMQRAGSTLVEQILASHSQIEGTRELGDLVAISRYIQTEVATKRNISYFDAVGLLSYEESHALGERYLESASSHRITQRLRFTDKMGANFALVGLIKLILPNAKIVDVRRHPLACGWSIFSQIFPRGENHAYRLSDIGRLYRDYVDLMAHFDCVWPGEIHRIFYEGLVTQPETIIRNLLEYLNLPFESECLEFYTNSRVVTTVSSQQVRTPIYKTGLEYWRNYEPWLGPLMRSLSSVLTEYPDVPEELQ